MRQATTRWHGASKAGLDLGATVHNKAWIRDQGSNVEQLPAVGALWLRGMSRHVITNRHVLITVCHDLITMG
jgi:hypothetical protein